MLSAALAKLPHHSKRIGATIVKAVEEGRGIFVNIRKFLRYLLSSNIGEVMTMFFGVLLARPMGLKAEENALVLPLLATQILWINLAIDGAPALALGLDPVDSAVVEVLPRPRSESVISGKMWVGIVYVGAVMAIATLVVPAFLQQAFSTVSLGFGDWPECAIAASMVLWARELSNRWHGDLTAVVKIEPFRTGPRPSWLRVSAINVVRG